MEDLNITAMNIILHAGDARTEAMKALDAIANFEFEEAERLLKAAKEEVVKAHRVHTAILQESIAEEKNEYTILFAHAQDTLMTINTEINLAEKMYKIMVAVSKHLKD